MFDEDTTASIHVNGRDQVRSRHMNGSRTTAQWRYGILAVATETCTAVGVAGMIAQLGSLKARRRLGRGEGYSRQMRPPALSALNHRGVGEGRDANPSGPHLVGWEAHFVVHLPGRQGHARKPFKLIPPRRPIAPPPGPRDDLIHVQEQRPWDGESPVAMPTILHRQGLTMVVRLIDIREVVVQGHERDR
jgi:hypothetical protein